MNKDTRNDHTIDLSGSQMKVLDFSDGSCLFLKKGAVVGVISKIEMEFNRAMSLKDMVNYFVDHGWSFDWDGYVIYWQEGESEDWIQEPYLCFENLVKRKENNRANISLALYFKNDIDKYRADVSFFDCKNKISLDCSWGKRICEYHKTSIDFSWYIEKLIPDPETSDLTINSISAFAKYP